MKIFGREPALWLALLYSVVVMVSAFVFPLSIDEQGAVNAIGAALVGLVTAWVVEKDGLSAAILGFIKSGLALGLAFGLHLAPDKQSIVMAFSAAVVAMFVRTQVTAQVVRAFLPLALCASLVFGVVSCGPRSERALKVDLNKAASGLNSAAKTNRALYQAHEISLEIRKKVATGIYDANEILLVALDVAKGINADNFTGSRAQILSLLSEASSKLAGINIGNPKIDLVIQSVIALINTAVQFVSALKSASLRVVDLPNPFRDIRAELVLEGAY